MDPSQPDPPVVNKPDSAGTLSSVPPSYSLAQELDHARQIFWTEQAHLSHDELRKAWLHTIAEALPVLRPQQFSRSHRIWNPHGSRPFNVIRQVKQDFWTRSAHLREEQRQDIWLREASQPRLLIEAASKESASHGPSSSFGSDCTCCKEFRHGRIAWVDLGTGHYKLVVEEPSSGTSSVVIIQVVVVDDSGKPLLSSRIEEDIIYHKQLSTLNVGSGLDDTDMAISLPEEVGCTFLWDTVNSVQSSQQLQNPEMTVLAAPKSGYQPSSHWSVSELQHFRAYIRIYGTNFVAIATALGTKTHTMVENQYFRLLKSGDSELEELAKLGNMERERGVPRTEFPWHQADESDLATETRTERPLQENKEKVIGLQKAGIQVANACVSHAPSGSRYGLLRSWTEPKPNHTRSEGIFKCFCGYKNDDDHTVLCHTCGTWQHVRCYYESALNVLGIHECVDCDPQPLDRDEAAKRQQNQRQYSKTSERTWDKSKPTPEDLFAITKPPHISQDTARTTDASIQKESFDCPIHKHHLLHNVPSPCNGFPVYAIPQVYSHLRTHVHSAFIPFVQQCLRCKEDFITRDTWKQHTAANVCQPGSRTKENRITPWVRLYFKLYPESSKVPSPWSGENIWLPESVTSQARDGTSNFATTVLFD